MQIYGLFTEYAAKTFQTAFIESILLKHEYVGTEHILLALIKRKNPILLRMEILEEVHDLLQNRIRAGSNKADETAFTRKVMTLAYQESIVCHRDAIDDNDMLVAFFGEPKCCAGCVLHECGLNINLVRGAVSSFRREMQTALDSLKLAFFSADTSDACTLRHAADFIERITLRTHNPTQEHNHV